MNSKNNQRRDFLKTMGIGTAALTIPFSGNAVPTSEKEKLSRTESGHLLNGYYPEFYNSAKIGKYHGMDASYR